MRKTKSDIHLFSWIEPEEGPSSMGHITKLLATLAAVATLISAIVFIYEKARLVAGILITVAVIVLVLSAVPYAKKGYLSVAKVARRRLAVRKHLPQLRHLAQEMSSFLNPANPQTLRNLLLDAFQQNHSRLNEIHPPDFLPDFHRPLVASLAGRKSPTQFLALVQAFSTIVRWYNEAYYHTPVDNFLMRSKDPVPEHLKKRFISFRESYLEFFRTFSQFQHGLSEAFGEDFHGVYLKRPEPLAESFAREEAKEQMSEKDKLLRELDQLYSQLGNLEMPTVASFRIALLGEEGARIQKEKLRARIAAVKSTLEQKYAVKF